MTIGYSDKASKALEPDSADIVTIDQASAITSVPKGTLRFMRAKGEGPASFLLGGRIRYRRAELLRWIAEQEAATSHPRRGR